VNLESIIEGCRNQSRIAQKRLYDQYSPVLFGIIRRYIAQEQDAEDILVEVLYKIFNKIDQFRGHGSFEGWMKRIAINEALMFLRKKKIIKVDAAMIDQFKADLPVIENELIYNDLFKFLNQLAPGYRTIFNLYVIEGYKHREIAELLGISINTSKSQLILAKQKLRILLSKNKEFNLFS